MKTTCKWSLVGAAVLLAVLWGARQFPIHDRRAITGIAKTKTPNGATESPAASLSTVTLATTDDQDDGMPRSAVAQMAQRQDAGIDDWDTEALSQRMLDRLRVVEDALEGRENAENLPVVEDEFSCGRLRPENLPVVFRDSRFVVRRQSDPDPESTTPFRSHSGFAAALESLVSVFGPGRKIMLKVVGIEKQADGLLARVRYEASGNSKSTARVQQTAEWQCRWNLPGASADELNLTRIVVENYEETEFNNASGSLFVDCAESALQRNDSYARQVLPGINHWLTRIPREFLNQFGHHGLAVGDANGDGLDDLYVCDAGGLPNRLYIQQADGTALDMAADSGVDLLEDSTGALLVDMDNDGDQDLVIATDPLIRVAENDGSGRFDLRDEVVVNTDTFSLSACDFDVDGDLDIYVCGYDVRKREPSSQGLPFPMPYHDANNGGRNLLLRNEGEFRFIDVTASVGLDVNNSRFSIAAAWEDFDNDGDLDLYVANDFGRNNLYRNGFDPEGRIVFVDIAAEAGVQDHASGMSVAWGDYNRDGAMDLYVGNMYSAAGNRVTYQRRFSDGVAPATVASLRRMARGNSLFANFSDSTRSVFQDVSLQQGVNMGRWAWASKFVDFSNDGWPDLVVANGYLTNGKANDL